ncbi:(Fe-S)-binding protein [Alicyclobacillus fastidiosus]|uniref:Glycolate oxidase iron-sulfur subunit n=1 Tax=Alicyclobacillus fastidiosus TaxID=392011 RepID=A0ABV5ABA9_9BACL|nr:(Fe-S)-binding protein [Alicyclobacillus fastidiosus]WEH10543.1 (Fe-S)-binding protein [Alicyclobacillus fastidiosus]
MSSFDMNELLNCMHCGFCLPSCPTFQQTGLETYSPRGRIALMKGVAEGTLPVDAEFEQNMYACLGCRACETACPAGVQYGALIEDARELIEDRKKARKRTSFARSATLKHLFMHPQRIRWGGHVLWAMQASGLQKFAEQTGLMKVLPREMAQMQAAVDTVASPAKRKRRQEVVGPDSTSRRRKELDAPAANRKPAMRVGTFTGCIMDVMFYDTNQATARLLAKAGCTVVFARHQVCCGALHAHSGEKADAMELAKQNIVAFEQADVELIVNNAGGCGAALKEYAHWFKDDPDWADRSRQFVSKMRDISELLAELPPLSFTKPVEARVTYQDSCHLAHGQGVRNQPRELIRSIPGVDYVELQNADSCCGSAGIYNITNYDMSMRILDEKMQQVANTKANLVVTTNPGCLLQMKKGILDAGLSERVQAVHIVDLLNQAL